MHGIVASPGIVLGKIMKLEREEIVVERVLIKDTAKEIAKYETAKIETKNQLEKVKTKAITILGEEEAEVFSAQLMMLEDPTLGESIINKINNEKLNAESAAKESVEEVAGLLENLDNDYMKERASDVRDVGLRLLHNLAGIPLVSLSELDEEVIIAAKDLTPSDTATMDVKKVLGFITDVGGRTSHTAIMARTLEIPAIVGTGNITSIVKNNDYVILDAACGEVIINPTDEEAKKYKMRQQALLEEKKHLEKLKNLPAQTIDGHRVEICANIGTIKDIDGVLRHGAEGIGLYRTEFVYMDSKKFPSEDEQFTQYRAIAEKMGNKPVIIRTLDIGGDKDLPYFDFPKELNPFLGWRAIRMCLDRLDIFKTQLRAILRASHYGNLHIMFPMVISIEEISEIKKVLETCKADLKAREILFDEGIKTGIMIETPAAVMMAERFAQEVDFFSIGTNDLTQYTLAVDRGNEKISHLYQPLHPSVLNSIKKVIDASHKAGIWTGMCGELAGDEKAALLLLGMGLDEFSMSAVSIPKVKNLIRNTSYKELEAAASKALKMVTTKEIINYLDNIMEGHCEY